MIDIARIEADQSVSDARLNSGVIFIAPANPAGILLGDARKQTSAVPS
jgi:hypothetical protein